MHLIRRLLLELEAWVPFQVNMLDAIERRALLQGRLPIGIRSKARMVTLCRKGTIAFRGADNSLHAIFNL